MSDKCLFVPIDINCRQYLPKVSDRPYTKLEALFSVQLDHFNKNMVSVSGYARLWQWSRNKVRKFLDDIGVIIEYDQIKKRTGEGQQKDRRRTAKGQIDFIDLRHLPEEKDSKRTGEGQQKDRQQDTTKKRVKENREKKKEIHNPLIDRQKFLENIPSSIKIKFPNVNYESITDDIIDYCQRSGKKYKDYYAAMRTFIKNDQKRKPQHGGPHGNYTDDFWKQQFSGSDQAQPSITHE